MGTADLLESEGCREAPVIIASKKQDGYTGGRGVPNGYGHRYTAGTLRGSH